MSSGAVLYELARHVVPGRFTRYLYYGHVLLVLTKLCKFKIQVVREQKKRSKRHFKDLPSNTCLDITEGGEHQR